MLLHDVDPDLCGSGPGRQLLTTFRAQTPGSGGGTSLLTVVAPPAEKVSRHGVPAEHFGPALAFRRERGLAWELHAPERRSRIHLPGYPFERQRYWAELPAAEEEVATIYKEPDLADWFYLPAWEYAIPPESNVANGKTRRWLVFENGNHVGADVVSRLRSQQNDVFQCKNCSQEYSQTGPFSYEIDPSERLDYFRLFNELRDSNLLPDRILHLWNVGPADDADTDRDIFDRRPESRILQPALYCAGFGETQSQ